MLNIDFINGLERIVGSTGILRDPNELLTYESDGLARLKATPGCVVLPVQRRTGSGNRAIVSLTHESLSWLVATERDCPAAHCRGPTAC